MATTTNYSWTTPDDTDLVKDGAAAIRTLGSSADTTVKDLNPGTTAGDIDYYTSSTAKARVAIGTAGQVLKVNAGGTAPEWGTTADQTPLTTKGDLFTFDTADARLGVGANGTVLTADSAETTGLKWATPASPGKVLQVVQGLKTDSSSTTSTSFIATGVTLTITPTANTSKILIMSTINVSGSSSTQPLFKLRRDNTTDLFVGDAAGSRPRVSGQTFTSNGNYLPTGNLMFLDSPATTSATTYEIYWRSEAASTIGLNRTVSDNDGADYGVRTASSIIALEIGA